MTTISNNSRRQGKQLEMVNAMIDVLLLGKSIAVIGCKHPQNLIDQLQLQNVKVAVEPMTARSEYDVSILTGYKFSLDT